MIREQIDQKYPKASLDNGEFIQRDKEWYDSYTKDIEESVPNQGYPPWSYGWYRSLDDGNSKWYIYAVRRMNVCDKCYKEWNQPYMANHCQCFADTMREASGVKINSWER